MILRIKDQVAAFREDPHLREVARVTLLALVLKIVGAGLAFGFNVAVARLLGAEGAGLYFLALAVVTIGSVIGRVGLDSALLRFVATQATRGDWAGVMGVYALSMRIAVFASGIVTLALFVSSSWVAGALFNKPELAEPLRWMSLSILPFALLNLQAEGLKGLKRIRDAMIVQGIGVPMVSILLVVPLAHVSGVLGASLAFLAGTMVVAVLGAWAWGHAIAGQDTSAATFPFRELWRSCKPLFVVSIMINTVRPWAPLFLLGIWATNEDVGIFGAALRVVTLTTFMLFTLNNVLAPKLAELHTKGDLEALASTARRSAAMIALLASPIFCVLIFGGHWVMEIYGKEFEQGALVLAILSAGQIVNVFTGPLGVILIVSGNENYTQNMATISTAVLLIMSVVLIPFLGGVGAALAIAVSGTGLSLASAWYVQHTLGIRAIPLLNRFSFMNRP